MMGHAWVLARRPTADVDASNLEWTAIALPALADGQILVRTIYLSLDPTNRLWMSDREQYLPPVRVGEVMRGVTIGVVEESRSDRFAPGDLVMPAAGGWQSHAVVDAQRLSRVSKREQVPLTASLSVLGPTGMTAYFGFLDLCAPKEGEIVVVSAAAGAVGSIVGQIAKIKGCTVIGIAGGAEKCAWLTDELGFDAAIDYKATDVGAALDRHCPDGIDILFENVGGAIMDASFARLRRNGRMALCGMIAGYNQEGVLAGPTDFGRVLMQRLTVRGFIVSDYLHRAREALAELSAWIEQGRLHWRDHVIEGLERAPAAMSLLFTGGNTGKLLVQVSPEP